MPAAQRQTLLQSIATTIVDYRQGEILTITPDHVDRWVCQFECPDQLTILEEMERLLKIYYVSRQEAKNIISRALTSQEIFGSTPAALIPHIQFLSIQRNGNSQNDLLALADEVTKAQYGMSITDCGTSPLGYIYLDDCLFSGNTALYDLRQWLPKAISGTTLYLIFLAAHTSGLRYLKRELNSEAQNHGVSVRRHYLQRYEFHNLSWDTQKFDCLWSGQISGDNLVDTYIQKVVEQCQGRNYSPRLFRPSGVPTQETIFSSPTARQVVERAFLKAGAYIVSLPNAPKIEMRPLGYEKLESLGFGAIFVTYRNIANNCPLALWWGDPNASPNHPFSKWYPLFPRRVNASSSS